MKAETKQNKTKKNDKYHRLFNHILDRGVTLFQATNITSLARKMRENFVVIFLLWHILFYFMSLLLPDALNALYFIMICRTCE